MNGMVTNNVRDLAVGDGVYGFLLNPQGHPQADLYIYNRGDCLLVDTDRSQVQKMLGIFDHFIIMDDVEFEDRSDRTRVLGLAGPGARRVLHNVDVVFDELKSLQFVDVVWRDAQLTITRSDNAAVESYEIECRPANTSPLMRALIEAGAVSVRDVALEWLRIASGIPRYGQDIRDRDLPQETDQTRALHFSKGCYIGQEIVERIRSRGNVHRKFTGFKVLQGLARAGAKIQIDGKEVGDITSVATVPAPRGNMTLALGYVRREFGNPGIKVVADDAQLEVATLPFKEAFS
jgi:folate-binding protein YgfZ